MHAIKFKQSDLAELDEKSFHEMRNLISTLMITIQLLEKYRLMMDEKSVIDYLKNMESTTGKFQNVLEHIQSRKKGNLKSKADACT
jgi:hypothetical protein